MGILRFEITFNKLKINRLNQLFADTKFRKYII